MLLQRFALGKANYWFCFVADSVTAIFFLAWALYVSPGHSIEVLLFGLAGFMVWGFSEYAFHRWMYHQPDSIWGEGHMVHHQDMRRLIAMPWFMTTGLMFLLWAAFGLALHSAAFSALLSGWLAGFVYYSVIHHAQHHWNFGGPWMRRLRAYHRVHHQFPECNFGVTMRFWDSVFGTRFQSVRHSRPTRKSGSLEGA